MRLQEQDRPAFRQWLLPKLPTISEAEPGLLADFVVLLFSAEVPREKRKQELADLVGARETGAFVDEIAAAIEQRSFAASDQPSRAIDRAPREIGGASRDEEQKAKEPAPASAHPQPSARASASTELRIRGVASRSSEATAGAPLSNDSHVPKTSLAGRMSFSSPSLPPAPQSLPAKPAKPAVPTGPRNGAHDMSKKRKLPERETSQSLNNGDSAGGERPQKQQAWRDGGAIAGSGARGHARGEAPGAAAGHGSAFVPTASVGTQPPAPSTSSIPARFPPSLPHPFPPPLPPPFPSPAPLHQGNTWPTTNVPATANMGMFIGGYPVPAWGLPPFYGNMVQQYPIAPRSEPASVQPPFSNPMVQHNSASPRRKCLDYETKGICLMGAFCLHKHGEAASGPAVPEYDPNKPLLTATLPAHTPKNHNDIEKEIDLEQVSKQQAQLQKQFEEKRKKAEEAAARSKMLARQAQVAEEELNKLRSGLLEKEKAKGVAAIAKKEQDAASGVSSTTKDLAKLQAEAESLFALAGPQVEPKSLRDVLSSRGRRGRGFGRGRGGRVLDNRPKRLVLAGVEAGSEKDTAIRNYLLTATGCNYIRQHKRRPSALVVGFEQRYQAERFRDEATRSFDLDASDLLWALNEASAVQQSGKPESNVLDGDTDEKSSNTGGQVELDVAADGDEWDECL